MARTVCAKVPDEMKAEIDRTEINVSAVVRAALDDELTRRRRSDLREDASALGERVADQVSEEEVATAVRETREEH
ncbi:hypothetical protein C448_07874 [Halococcus morrhuae DSM 1307]|uniref:Ribbon-helix-helix protein CopG domain-containing protein n=1 Tax=Halococcus morrhuae DSM 1307 TaxID=931277 RepID=M0MK00_HALMO|nr:hypothetical protein [Halococcus morrhuae]EMA45044.1 hypothetical protein C448_07874 [Halococcus morrhuae DSM 1307]